MGRPSGSRDAEGGMVAQQPVCACVILRHLAGSSRRCTASGPVSESVRWAPHGKVVTGVWVCLCGQCGRAGGRRRSGARGSQPETTSGGTGAVQRRRRADGGHQPVQGQEQRGPDESSVDSPVVRVKARAEPRSVSICPSLASASRDGGEGARGEGAWSWAPPRGGVGDGVRVTRDTRDKASSRARPRESQYWLDGRGARVSARAVARVRHRVKNAMALPW